VRDLKNNCEQKLEINYKKLERYPVNLNCEKHPCSSDLTKKFVPHKSRYRLLWICPAVNVNGQADVETVPALKVVRRVGAVPLNNLVNVIM
jgi:hypothetical protein